MAAPNEITIPQLLRLIGTPDCPVLVDVCIDPDHDADPFLIPGALRHPHTDITGLRDRLAGRSCVVICQKGKKLSQGGGRTIAQRRGASRISVRWYVWLA